jgi:uncharacterized protein HemY
MATMNANDNVQLHDATELQEHSQRHSQSVEQQQELSGALAQSLPRCDGGNAAWKLLISAFVFEALLWGM